MTKRVLFIGLLCLWWSTSSGQTIKDPVEYFYRTVALSGSDKITVLEGNLTGNGRYSFLISDGQRQPELNEGYAWDVYYPDGHNAYLKADSEYVGDVPDYIGFVKEIKRDGIVQAVTYKRSNVVSVQFLDDGAMNTKILFDDTADYKKQFPKYFAASPNFKVATYTYMQLKKRYGSSNPSAAAIPASK
jgi:nitrogen fixation-related uncharacterized protein